MKIIYEYSHLGGSEILQVRFPLINEKINSVIKDVVASRTKISREKTMKDKKLFSPKDMNSQFKKCFNAKGFSELKDRYTIEIPDYPKKIPNVFKQIDFVKEKVLVEVQFGKYAFMFYDMAKFQYFFNEKKLKWE